MEDLQTIKVQGLKLRAAIAAAVLLTLFLGWISISYRLGGMVAEQTSSSDPDADEIAAFSHSLAPSDPETNSLLAATSDDPAVAITHYQRTVSLAPADHRWRVALGRAYEQAERFADAEAELKEAVRLAPSYSYPHWHLGNFYLRQDREDDASVALRIASQNHYSFREQVFSLAWDYSGGNPAQVERMSADNAEVRAYLSKFLATRGAAQESLSVWNKLSQEDKEKYRDVGRWTVLELYTRHQYGEAIEIARQVGDSTAMPEQVTNPSFEEPNTHGDHARFVWQLTPGEPRVELGFDSRVKHSGNRSFRIAFRSYPKQGFADLFQTVVVKPDHNYVLQFRIRTEGLASAGPPMIQVSNAVDNSEIAVSDPFPPDSSEWRLISVSFRTPANCRAVSIRTVRSFCGDNCVITGTLWYDDFELVPARS